MENKIESYRCKNCSMFFDRAKYSECPFCGTPIGKNVTEENDIQKGKENSIKQSLHKIRMGNFNKENKELEDDKPTEARANSFQKPTNIPEDEKPTKATVIVQSLEEPKNVNTEIDTDKSYNEPLFDVKPSVASDNDTLSLSIDNARSNSLVIDDVKTNGYFSLKKNKDVNTTEYSNSVDDSHITDEGLLFDMTDEPVVGWLVGINGPYLGQSVKMFAGKNSIGRNNTNKIVLGSDKGISREKHAWVTYEPIKRDYYIQPGDSSGLTYINDDVVMDAKIMNAYDIIGLGTSKFVFIPLCGKNFSWDDYID